MLSVFHRYLALDGVSHPFRAAISGNPTLRGKKKPQLEKHPTFFFGARSRTGFSPSMIPLSREKDLYLGGRVRCDLTKLQFGGYERKTRRRKKQKIVFSLFPNPQISNLSFSRFARSY